ncbi:MAG: FlgB family protein [Paracoccaceae bacterium]
MSFDLTILQMASGLAQHSGARLSLVSQNIANADTPGYTARDLPDFGAAWASSQSVQLSATRAGHFGAVAGQPGTRATESAAFGSMSPNGNNVAIEDQMMRAAAIRQEHELALGVWSKSLDMLRTAIGKRR